jgi:hypothetical protein
MRRLVVVVALLVVAAPLVILYAQGTDAPTAASDAKPIIPVALLWVKKPMEGGMIENVRVVSLGSRSFIVGRQPDVGVEKNDPRTGKTYWFPVDDVQGIIEFPNLKQAKEYHDKVEELTE